MPSESNASTRPPSNRASSRAMDGGRPPRYPMCVRLYPSLGNDRGHRGLAATPQGCVRRSLHTLCASAYLLRNCSEVYYIWVERPYGHVTQLAASRAADLAQAFVFMQAERIQRERTRQDADVLEIDAPHGASYRKFRSVGSAS